MSHIPVAALLFGTLVAWWDFGVMDTLDFGSVLLIAVGLSADCFAVAVGASTSSRGSTFVGILQLGLAFGVAQAVMPVLGWLVGRTLVDWISDYDHWVAFGLLIMIGARMIWESFHPKEGGGRVFPGGLVLLTLAVATSIDALAVGLSFAFLKVNMVMAVMTIGGVAFVITGSGFLIGRKAGQVLGERAGGLGGIILISIGIRILVGHLVQ